MLHSKLFFAALQEYNQCRTVVAKQSSHPCVGVWTAASLKEKGIAVDESVCRLFSKERDKIPSEACIHLFSVREELLRRPRATSAVTFRNIQRAVYVRGRLVRPLEAVCAALYSRHLFGDRLILFPLQSSIEMNGIRFSFLAWRSSSDSGEGAFVLVPRKYLFTADTWIAYGER